MVSTTRLEWALENAAEVFAGDYELLKSIAHGHVVNKNSILVPPKQYGAYELRIPGMDIGEEVKGCRQASTINVLCPDQRQAADVAAKLTEKGAVWLSPAAGAAQVEKVRFDAVVDVIAETMSFNQKAHLNATGHSGECGGVRNSLKSEFKVKIMGDDGKDGSHEQAAMRGLIGHLVAALINNKDIDHSRISVLLAHVDSNDRFVGLD